MENSDFDIQPLVFREQFYFLMFASITLNEVFCWYFTTFTLQESS